MLHRSSITQVWLLGCATAALIVAAYLLDTYVSAILLALAVPTAWACIMATLDYIGDRIVAGKVRLLDAEANTEQVRILHILSTLNEGQVDALKYHNLDGALDNVRERTINVRGVEIPVVWARAFCETDDYLPPIRDYGDGSHERLWAKTITDHVVREGWARAGSGSLRAAWLNHRAAITALGLEE